MQHIKDEYIFQLVTGAVKEIDPSETGRKREIFKILAKSGQLGNKANSS